MSVQTYIIYIKWPESVFDDVTVKVTFDLLEIKRLPLHFILQDKINFVIISFEFLSC